MKTYLLFGIEGTDLEAARARLERVLGIKMELHESGYRCGDYYLAGRRGQEHYLLQKNFDSADNEWTQPGFPECGLLLYANDTDKADVICAALAQEAKLISREEL